MATADAPAANKPKARTALLTVLGILALLVGGGFALDNWARQAVANFAAQKIEQLLSLDSDQPVTVDIGGASVIAQVLTGRLDEVSAGVDNVTIGDLTGGVHLDAQGIPVNLSDPASSLTQPIDKVEIQFSVTSDSLQKIGRFVSLGAVNDVHLVDNDIYVGSNVSLLGVPLSVGMGVEPFAEDGTVGFTPQYVQFNGTQTSAADFQAKHPTLGPVLFAPRSVCIARWLPQALTVDAVAVVDAPVPVPTPTPGPTLAPAPTGTPGATQKQLVILIGANKGIFDDPSLRKPGSCPSDAG